MTTYINSQVKNKDKEEKKEEKKDFKQHMPSRKINESDHEDLPSIEVEDIDNDDPE